MSSAVPPPLGAAGSRPAIGRLTRGHPLATSKEHQSFPCPLGLRPRNWCRRKLAAAMGFFMAPGAASAGTCLLPPLLSGFLPARGFLQEGTVPGSSPPEGTTVPSVPAFALVSVSCVFRPRWSGKCQDTQPVCFGPRGLPPSLCWVPRPCAGPWSRLALPLRRSPSCLTRCSTLGMSVTSVSTRGRGKHLAMPTWLRSASSPWPPAKEKIEKEDTVAARG